MRPLDRKLKKQLLVMKGEALRTKLRLEWAQLRHHPLGLAEAGVRHWAGFKRFGQLAETLAGWLPGEGAQRWLRRTGRALLLWQLCRKLLSRL